MTKPSSLSTWAMRVLSLVEGMSTAARSMRAALRMRVSMSAIGSVIMVASPSPTRLLDARDQAVAGQVAEADAADAELPVHRPRPAAHLAAQADADLLARQHLDLVGGLLAGLQLGQLLPELDEFCFGCHGLPCYASRNGMPKARSSSRASSSLFVLVTKVTSIPCVNVTLSGSISGKTICSDRPRL